MTRQVANREELLEYTADRWEALVSWTDALDDEQWTSRRDAAGWSIKDHAAHVVAWDDSVVQLIEAGRPMQESLQVPGEEWAVDYDAINERLRAMTRELSVAEVKAWRDDTWTNLAEALSALTARQLAAPACELGLNTDEGDMTALLHYLVDYQGGHYDAHLEHMKKIIDKDV